MEDIFIRSSHSNWLPLSGSKVLLAEKGLVQKRERRASDALNKKTKISFCMDLTFCSG